MSERTRTAFHAVSGKDAVNILKTDEKRGLRGAEAEARLSKYGRNALKKGKKKSFFRRFLL